MRSWKAAIAAMAGMLALANCGGGGGNNGVVINNPNPTPIIQSTFPGIITQGSQPFTLFIQGINFIAGSKGASFAFWNGSPRSTFFNQTTTQLEVQISAQDVAMPGLAQVTVVNPGPGGGVSGAVSFEIQAPVNPPRTISSFLPASTAAGGAAFKLTVNGTNFVSTDIVTWNGELRLPSNCTSLNNCTACPSPAECIAEISNTDIAAAGSASVAVLDTVTGLVESPSVNFPITGPNNPVPSISSLSPSSTIFGGPDFELNVNGSNFVRTSIVDWNGMQLATEFVNSGLVVAWVPAGLISATGTASVTVVNPPPGGGTSTAATFTISNNPVPQLTLLSPSSASVGGSAFILTVNGTDFVPASTVNFAGVPLMTSYSSDTQLLATVPAAEIAVAGNFNVTVVNPAPGGGTSNALVFMVTNLVPAISSLDPSSVTAGSSGFGLNVNGSNFVTTSVVDWAGSALTTTFVNNGLLIASVPASDVAAAGTVNVTVVNPSPGGGTSTPAVFTIDNPAPSITSINPSTAVAGAMNVFLTVNGTNFVPTSAIEWNGSKLTTAFVNSGELTATIPSGDTLSAGNASVTVVNPTPGGGPSNAATFTITH